MNAQDPFIRSLSVDRASIGDPRAYPFSIPALADLSELELDPHVTFLAGANASGKSTLIEAIAVAAGLNPEGGGRNFTFQTRSSHSPLGDVMRLVRGTRRPRTDYFLRAESFYTLASAIEELGVEEGYGVARCMSNRTGSRSWRSSASASRPTASTCSTSRSRRSRRRASWRCCGASTSWSPTAASS